LWGEQQEQNLRKIRARFSKIRFQTQSHRAKYKDAVSPSLKSFVQSPGMERILQKTEQDKALRRSLKDGRKVTFYGPGNFKSYHLHESSDTGGIFMSLNDDSGSSRLNI
jgi:hypothetical protein